MNLIRVTFLDNTKYECNITNKELSYLTISVNSTHINEAHDEDYLSIRCGTTLLLIAPMREIKRYELILGTQKEPIDSDKIKDWWS